MDELQLHQLKDLLIDPEVENNFKKRKVLYLLNEIYRSRNKESYLVLTRNFCEDLLENNKIQAVQIILNALKYDLIDGHRISFKTLQLKVLKLKGDLQKQNDLLIEILEYCVIRKNYTKGKELLELDGYILFPEQYYILKLCFMSQSGDYEAMDKLKEFDFIVERYLSGSTLGFKKLDKILEGHLISQKIDLLNYKLPKLLFVLKSKFILNKIILKKRLESQVLDECEYLLNAFYGRIVLYPDEITNYILLAMLGSALERKQILLSIKAVILTNPNICTNAFYENLLNLYLNKISLMKDEMINVKELDEQLIMLIDKKEKRKGDISDEKTRRSPFKLMDKGRDERELIHLLKSCEFIDKKDLGAHFKDLIMSFIFLEGLDVALSFIERFSDEYGDSCEKLIEIDYLKIEILTLSERFDEAEMLCNKSIEEHPLTENEKIIFLYLLGIVKLKKGLKAEAIEILRSIKAKKPNYRSVKWRLKEIEGR